MQNYKIKKKFIITYDNTNHNKKKIKLKKY